MKCVNKFDFSTCLYKTVAFNELLHALVDQNRAFAACEGTLDAKSGTRPVEVRIYHRRAAEHTEFKHPRSRCGSSPCAPRFCGDIFLPSGIGATNCRLARV